MTTLGKILVFAVLVFSLIAAALIVMDYIPRTNWYLEAVRRGELADLRLEQKNIAEAEKKATIDESNERNRISDDKIKELSQTVAQRVKEVEDLRAQLQDQIAQAKKHQAAAEASALAVNRLREENAGLQTQLNQRLEANIALQTEVKNYRDEAVKAQIAYNSARDRNEQLVEQIEDLAKELVRQQNKAFPATASTINGTPAANRPNPPPEEVRGLVKATDPDHGLVTITLGSDAGINRQNTLEVYRLKPPTYLGRIEIIDVRHNEAVGRLINGSNRANRIQVGDEVASNILGAR
jgi:hypothetical protein